MNYFLEEASSLNEDILIGYLNGSLSAIETLNDGPYTGNTFQFTKLPNLNNERELSIITALLRHWTVELNQLEDLYQDLDKTLNEYCRQHAWTIRDAIAKSTNVKPDDTLIQQILEITNFPMVKGRISGALQLLLKENYTAYAVKVIGTGWYEATYKDYFFDCNGTYYYLHFGISD
jgi:hypothetical protein